MLEIIFEAHHYHNISATIPKQEVRYLVFSGSLDFRVLPTTPSLRKNTVRSSATRLTSPTNIPEAQISILTVRPIPKGLQLTRPVPAKTREVDGRWDLVVIAILGRFAWQASCPFSSILGNSRLTTVWWEDQVAPKLLAWGSGLGGVVCYAMFRGYL